MYRSRLTEQFRQASEGYLFSELSITLLVSIHRCIASLGRMAPPKLCSCREKDSSLAWMHLLMIGEVGRVSA